MSAKATAPGRMATLAGHVRLIPTNWLPPDHDDVSTAGRPQPPTANANISPLVAVLAGLVMVAMVVGCVSTGVWLVVSHRDGTNPPTTLQSAASRRASPSQPANPSQAATASRPVSPSATTSAGLTGLGATKAFWQAHHTADTTFFNAYDPDPNLPPIGGHPGPRYVEVTFAGGLVSTYTLRFPRGTSSTDALAQVRDQFPPT